MLNLDMATKTTIKKPNPLSAAAALLGRKGGLTTTDKPKGFATMSKRKRVELGRKGGLAKGKPRGK